MRFKKTIILILLLFRRYRNVFEIERNVRLDDFSGLKLGEKEIMLKSYYMNK